METKFNHLRKQFYGLLIISITVTVLLIAIFLTIAAIFKIYWLALIPCFFGFFLFPAIMSTGGRRFFNAKALVIKEAVLLEDDGMSLSYQYIRENTLDDLVALNSVDMAQAFNLSSDIEGVYKDAVIRAYSVRFRTSDKKLVLGRVIRLSFLNKVNTKESDIKGAFLKKATYTNKVKIVDNVVYILAASYYSSKVHSAYSLEPLDFKTYDEFKERIKGELEFIKDTINTISKQQ